MEIFDPQFSSYVVILLNCWSSYAAAAPPHKCPHLPERVSDRVCFWPPCLPPCTEGHGHSFPDQSEKVNRFRKDHSGYFMWHLFPLPYLVVQGRNVKCGVPWGIVRRGVCPIKEQMLQMLGKALLARLFNVKRVTERFTNGQRPVEKGDFMP